MQRQPASTWIWQVQLFYAGCSAKREGAVKTLSCGIALLACLFVVVPVSLATEPVVPSPESTEPSTASLPSRLESLRAVADSRQQSGSARINAIVQAYEAMFTRERQPQAWAGLASGDLLVLFDAMHEAGFYSGSLEHAGEMAGVFLELESRGLSTAEHVAALHRMYIHTRMFDEARALAIGHASLDLEDLPDVRQTDAPGAPRPKVWTVDPEAHVLSTLPIDLAAGTTIIVVSHPLCAFSRAAALAIADDATLGPVFARQAHWIAPPAERLHLDLIRRWNQMYPTVPMSLTIRESDWPLIDYWGTPAFYFFRNGELVAQVTGWPLDGEGRRAEVLGALQEVGLLD